MPLGRPYSLTPNVNSKNISVVATAGQTSFAPSGGYRVNDIQVYRNGSRLSESTDFTANDGVNVVLKSAATASDVIGFTIFDSFEIADALNANGDQTISGNLTLSGDLGVVGLATAQDVNVSGTCTANAFNGNITGDATGLSGTPSITVNLLTAADANVSGACTFSGAVSVGGTLTYADVTNIDSVGLVTARNGLRVLAGGIQAVGVYTGLLASGIATVADGIRCDNGGIQIVGVYTGFKASGVSTFGGGDIHIDGDAVGVTSVTWDASANSLIFKDNSYAKFGDGSDLAVYHDGSNGYILNNTGNLVIRAKTGETGIEVEPDGAVDLRYDNSVKLETTTAGTVVTGILTATSFDGDSGVVKFTTNGTERARIAAAGNVGVNTTDPQELLSVSQGNLFVSNSSAPQIRISKDNTDASDNDRTMLGQATGSSNFVTGSAAGDTVLRGNTTGAVLFGIGTAEKARLTATGGISLNNGELIERCNISGTALNSDTAINLDNGMIHYRTGAIGSANVKPNIFSSVGINTQMATGDIMTVTIITACSNTSNFVDAIMIDYKDVTENWVGGSAPTAGGGSGVDTYAFNIIKTASETFTVIGNHVMTS